MRDHALSVGCINRDCWRSQDPRCVLAWGDGRWRVAPTVTPFCAADLRLGGVSGRCESRPASDNLSARDSTPRLTHARHQRCRPARAWWGWGATPRVPSSPRAHPNLALLREPCKGGSTAFPRCLQRERWGGRAAALTPRLPNRPVHRPPSPPLHIPLPLAQVERNRLAGSGIASAAPPSVRCAHPRRPTSRTSNHAV